MIIHFINGYSPNTIPTLQNLSITAFHPPLNTRKWLVLSRHMAYFFNKNLFIYYFFFYFALFVYPAAQLVHNKIEKDNSIITCLSNVNWRKGQKLLWEKFQF